MQVKIVANIEFCQNHNTKTLLQSIANLKNELLSKDKIIKVVSRTDLPEKKSPLHRRTRNPDTTKNHNKNLQ